jgi:hypothetical protein
MRSLAGLVIVVAPMVGFVLGEGPPTDPPLADPVRQFQRDEGLIVSLVEGGLLLAAAEDALKRADTCNGLVDKLTQEIRQAATDSDVPRAAALGRHLHAMLVGGVATNVKLARDVLPPRSPREQELRRITEKSAALTHRAEEALRNLAERGKQDTMEMLAQSVFQGGKTVENAFRGESVPTRAVPRKKPTSPGDQ